MTDELFGKHSLQQEVEGIVWYSLCVLGDDEKDTWQVPLWWYLV